MSEPFLYHRRVNFVETDMAGIVHFSNIMRYMEEAEHAFLRSHGLGVHQTFEGRTISWPRLSVKCDFLSPARFDDELTIATRVSNLGRKSITHSFDMAIGDRRVARGEIVAVCCEMHPGGVITSIEIPPPIADLLRP